MRRYSVSAERSVGSIVVKAGSSSRGGGVLSHRLGLRVSTSGIGLRVSTSGIGLWVSTSGVGLRVSTSGIGLRVSTSGVGLRVSTSGLARQRSILLMVDQERGDCLAVQAQLFP